MEKQFIKKMRIPIGINALNVGIDSDTSLNRPLVDLEMCTRKNKKVYFEMKYIGWNVGAVRIERSETKADIEILEMSIDGVDILKILDSSLFKEK